MQKVEIISELKFRNHLYQILERIDGTGLRYVTGPGRSGAIAAVYASHFLGLPFLAWKTVPQRLGENEVLVVDTAKLTGATVRKAMSFYNTSRYVVPFNEPPRVKFWYEQV